MPNFSANDSNAYEQRYNRQSATKGDLAMSAAELLLQQLRNAMRFAPVPYLQDAATVAIDILNTVQDIKSHKAAFLQLAYDAAELVSAVLTKVNQTTMSDELVNDLRDLVMKLRAIEAFVKKEAKRKMWKRLIMSKGDQDTIQQYRQHIDQSLKVFGLQSNIAMQDKIDRIEAYLIAMNAQNDPKPPSKTNVPFTKEQLLKERKRRQTSKTSNNIHTSQNSNLGSGSMNMQNPSGNGNFYNAGFVNSGNYTNITNSNNNNSINIWH